MASTSAVLQESVDEQAVPQESVEDPQEAEFKQPLKKDTKARNWFITINNPGESNDLPQHPNERYAIWQREKGEKCGTEHWHATLVFSGQQRFSAIKELYPRAHIAPVRNLKKAMAYCSKEETRIAGFWERGDKPQQGKRKDLDEFVEDAFAGMSRDDALLEHKEVSAKCPRYVDSVYRLIAKRNAPKFLDYTPWYAWQQRILDVVKTEPHARHIYWVYDQYGNAGKSLLCRHLVHAHGAFMSSGGKKADIAFQYNGERIVIFDFAREQAEYFSYSVMEEIKNGMMSSSKYESHCKWFASPHLIVFANFDVPEGKFSADRIQRIELGWDHHEVGAVAGTSAPTPLVTFF